MHDPSPIDPLFRPLDQNEEPAPYLAGSGRALEHLLTHVFHLVAVV
jgi:hypothetical protein